MVMSSQDRYCGVERSLVEARYDTVEPMVVRGAAWTE